MYQVFARKWRPQTFADIVGQTPTATTLQNAIESGHVHHAYLFAGPRGIGKTSIARIFSKALNCEKGPAREPCNKCDSCKSITAGTSVDVIEIDGASNNSVEDIRTLREHVLVSPMNSRYKIYIIDEVHMLSIAAFNALLKTLEEPPGHIKFMFATTEPHKIPATIISRCQRFDLKRISTVDIVERLAKIAEREGIQTDDGALPAIARNSQGAMRDAESIFDQITSFCGTTISSKDVTSILGLVSDEMFWDVDDAILGGNVEKGFEIARSVVEGGKHITRFVEDLITHFRNLLVAKSSNSPGELLDMGEDEVGKHVELSKRFRREQLLYMMDVLADTLDKMRFAISHRVSLEMALVRLIRSNDRVFIDDLIEKLHRHDGYGDSGGGDLFGGRSGASMVKERKGNPGRGKSNPGSQAAPRKYTVNSETQKGADATPLQELTKTDRDELTTLWGRILSGVKSPRLKEQLSFGKLIEVNRKNNTVRIGFMPEDSYHMETINSDRSLGTIKHTLSEHLGNDVNVIVEKMASGETKKDDRGGNSLMQNGIVKKAQELFGGKFMSTGR